MIRRALTGAAVLALALGLAGCGDKPAQTASGAAPKELTFSILSAENQASMTPLTMLILISFFCSFAVLDNPDGTLAHVSSFIPFSAPITMPPRIALGEAPAVEILAAFAVTVAGALALIPLAGRIYSGAVLRTGSAVKIREAWRATG